MASKPALLDMAATSLPLGFDMDEHLNSMFRLFSTERKKVGLLCSNDVMDSVIDRFGEDDEEHFTAEVEIAVNNVFLS